MRSLAAPILFALALALAGSPVRAAAPAPEEIGHRLDVLAALYRDLGIFDGVVLLARDGEVVVERGYGMASHELAVPNSPENHYRVASLSKAITKVAIGRLWEDGKLDLETRLARFLPDFPEAERISIRQLLEHRSGVPHINALDWYERESRHHIELDEILERLATQPLDFEPGSERSYSNGGYALLAKVIELASGAPYGEFLHREVLDPLGMHETGHDRHELLLAGRASGYVPGPAPGSRVPAQYVEPSIKIGGGSLYSTVRDWLAFDRAFYRDNVLQTATWEALFPFEDRQPWMTGRAPGFYAVHRRLGEWTLIVFANNYSVHPLDDELPAVLEAETFEPPSLRTDVPVSVERWRAWAGRYRWPEPWGTEIEIRLEDGYATYVELFRDQRVGLFPQEGSAFYLPLYNAPCRFVEVEGGDHRVSHIECTPAWSEQPVRLERLGE